MVNFVSSHDGHFGLGGGGVTCRHGVLQQAAPIGRSPFGRLPFVALPLDPLPPKAVVPISLSPPLCPSSSSFPNPPSSLGGGGLRGQASA